MKPGTFVIIALFTLWPAAVTLLHAESVLMYDEEKGIIFVDKATGKPIDAPIAMPKGKENQLKPELPVEPSPTPSKPSGTSRRADGLSMPMPAVPGSNIHAGRKQDPSTIYYESGIEYFRNKDFSNALKNFLHADSIDPQPYYSLWVGKSFRALNRPDRMAVAMKKILNIYPQSEVADDALFELAFYNQVSNNYDSATALYGQLAERYPFGTSFSNGQEFLSVSREQRKLMKAEMISDLNVMGFRGEELSELYRAFQKARKLPVTGIGDPGTISAIKGAYQALLDGETSAELRRVRLAGRSKWVWAGALFLLFNIGLLIRTAIVGRTKLREVGALRQAIRDLKANTP